MFLFNVIIGIGTAIITSLGVSATIASFVVKAGLAYAGSQYLKRQARKGLRGVGDRSYRHQEPAAQVPARWIYGKARVAGVPVYVQEHRSGSTEYLWVVYLLSEGDIRGISRVWMGGREVPLPPGNLNNRPYTVIHAEYAADSVHGVQGHWHGHTGRRNIWAGRANTLSSSQSAAARAVAQAERDYWQDAKDGFDWSGNPVRIWVMGGPYADPDYVWPTNSLVFPSWVNYARAAPLKDVSAVGVMLQNTRGQYNSTGIPHMEFLVHGVKIQEPDGTEAVWTDNAASIRRHWLINARGIDPAKIDLDAYYAARAYCGTQILVPEVTLNDAASNKVVKGNDVLTAVYGENQSTWPRVAERQVVLDIWNERHAGTDNQESRYSINGVIEADMDDRAVEDAMDFCWAGHAPEWNGKIVFRPGRETVADYTVEEKDIADAEAPAWQLQPELSGEVTSLAGSLTASARHRWLEYVLPRVSAEGAENHAPLDLGRLPLVAYDKTASRLMRIHLARSRGRTGRLTLLRGTNWSAFGVYPARRISLDLPSEGLTAPNRYYVTSGEYSFNGLVRLEVAEETPGLYDVFPDIPHSIIDSDAPLTGAGLPIPPPNDLRLSVRAVSGEDIWYLEVGEDTVDFEYVHVRVRLAVAEGATENAWEYGGLGWGGTAVYATGTYDYQIRYDYPTETTDWAPVQTIVVA